MRHPLSISRRDALRTMGAGFGMTAFAGLAGAAGPWAPKQPHFAAKAKHVIFVFLNGGLSQVDSFDPKPQLAADSVKPFAMKIEPTQFNNNGSRLGSPWKFQQYGESGLPISDLFPNIAKHSRSSPRS